MNKLTLGTDKNKQLGQNDSSELQKTDKSTTTIDLGASKEYEEQLCETIDYLTQAQEKITGLMFAIAVNGKWKKWSDEQTVGTTITLNQEFLRDSGDKNIDLLMTLCDKINDTKDELKTQNPRIVKALEEREAILNTGETENNITSVTLFYEERPEIIISMELYFNEKDELFFSGQDCGELVKQYMGDSDYEYTYTVKPNEVNKLYKLFNFNNNDRTALLLELKKRFNGNDAYSLFAKFMKENNIEFESFTWM